MAQNHIEIMKNNLSEVAFVTETVSYGNELFSELCDYPVNAGFFRFNYSYGNYEVTGEELEKEVERYRKAENALVGYEEVLDNIEKICTVSLARIPKCNGRFAAHKFDIDKYSQKQMVVDAATFTGRAIENNELYDSEYNINDNEHICFSNEL